MGERIGGPFRTPEDLEEAYAMGLLRKTDLVHGQYYRGRCYQTAIARWHEGAQVFVFIQTASSKKAYQTMKHPADDRYRDVFRATEPVEPKPEEVMDDAKFEEAVIPKKPRGISMHTPLGTDEDLEAAYAEGLLKKEQLEHGKYYHGLCRNAQIARWHAGAERFVHLRTKFGNTFYEAICHPADERDFDVFRVTGLAEPTTEQLLDDERFEQTAKGGMRA